MVAAPRNSNWEYRDMLARRTSGVRRWLDLGCGHQLLPAWMADAELESRRLVDHCGMVVGVDQLQDALVRHSTIRRRVAADSMSLPFGSGTFDLITANMVVEHIEDVGRLMIEIRRVLAPDGLFVFHTPNRLFYQIWLSLSLPISVRRRAASAIEGRLPEDVFPTHYRMNTCRQLLALAKSHRFNVEEIRLINSSLVFQRFRLLASVERAIDNLLEIWRFDWARSNLVAAMRKAD